MKRFEPFDALDTDAADQLQPVGREVAGLVVVADRARRMHVFRLEPQRRIRPRWPVVAGVALTGAVVGMATGDARPSGVAQPDPPVERRLRLSGGL